MLKQNLDEQARLRVAWTSVAIEYRREDEVDVGK